LRVDAGRHVALVQHRAPGDIASVLWLLARQKKLAHRRPSAVGADQQIAIIDADNQQRDAGPWTIAPGELFVLADNRDSASDSRNWGPIPASAVIGRAVVIWYSLAGDRFRYDRALLPIR